MSDRIKASVRVVLPLFLMTLFFLAPAAADEDERGFYFQIGGGFAAITYPNEYESLINELASDPNITRVIIDLNLSLGYALTQNLYGAASITGIGDRLEDQVDYLQTNTYLYGLGLKGYPFDTGLQLGISLGPSRLIQQTSFAGSATSPWGFGGAVSAGWDFRRSSLTGPSAILGVRVGSYSIEGDGIGSASLYLSFLYK